MEHQEIAQLLGNYGEFVGAIAVVATLAYLTAQIRASNRLARAGAFRSPNSDLNTLNASFMQLEGFRRALPPAMGGKLPSDLHDEDALILDVYLVCITNLYEQIFREVREGILDDIAMGEFGARFWFGTPYYRANWPIYKQSFGPTFSDNLEQRFDVSA